MDLRSIGREFESWPLRYRVQPWASCYHTCASVTKQYNLVPTNGRWCLAAGKVTVGLASHWPCVTDNSGNTTYGLMALEREMSTPPIPSRNVAQFTFTMKEVPLEFCDAWWVQKPEWWGYQSEESVHDIFSRFNTIQKCDKQTDRQTSDGRLRIPPGGKNNLSVL